jgi:hypothetical protein
MSTDHKTGNPRQRELPLWTALERGVGERLHGVTTP